MGELDLVRLKEPLAHHRVMPLDCHTLWIRGGATASRETVVLLNQRTNIIDNVWQSKARYGGVQVALSVELNQAHRWFVAKCVRRIIEFYIMLRTPAKLLLLGSYDLAYKLAN